MFSLAVHGFSACRCLAPPRGRPAPALGDLACLVLPRQVFAPLNVTIILSSLELWVDEDQMATAGEAPELLWRFLRWKSLHRPLRPHDLSYLLV